MAKQNPATDPVSAAMSAIESALNLTDDDEAVLASRKRLYAPARSRQSRRPRRLFSSRARSPAMRRRSFARAPSPQSVPDNETKPAIPPATPANDDRENVGAILQAMNARPASRTPFILALIASLLWAAICALYAYVVGVALGLEATPRDAAATRNAAIFAGGAGTNHLHVRLCRALAAAARAATIGARDLAGRGASGRTRDDGGRACREPVPGHPSRTHVDGGWRGTCACPRRGARDPRAI